MKRKHSYEKYFNAIGAHTVANPTPLNKAIWGLMKHCRMEIVQTKFSDSIEYVGRRMDARELQDALYDLFEEHITLKQGMLASNKKIKIWNVNKIDIPKETSENLIRLHKYIDKQKQVDDKTL